MCSNKNFANGDDFKNRADIISNNPASISNGKVNS